MTFYCVIISESVYQQLQKETKQSMKNAYAEGTFKNLRTQIETFLIFCEYFKLSPLPVSVETLCMYAQFLNRSFRSVSSINNYLSGVKTLHLLLDVEYPQNNMTQLNLLLRGISRCKQHVVKKAMPITPNILMDLYRYLNFSCSFDIVFWTLCLLMLFLMARKSNMIPTSVSKFDPKKQLTREDINLQDDYLILNIKWSKTRQFGHSRQIPVTAIPGCCLCPVKAYSDLLQNVNCPSSSSAFTNNTGKSKLSIITYNQFQNRLRQVISSTGRDGNLYSSHGFRRGSASWAFKSNVESELIQHHGDWLSAVYTEYLNYDFEQKISVSRKMSSRILAEI